MPLNKDWREFLELLNSNGVEYLVVGAFAVAFHGYPRYTADLDLLVRPTEVFVRRAYVGSALLDRFILANFQVELISARLRS
jgi:hypothetical protein